MNTYYVEVRQTQTYIGIDIRTKPAEFFEGCLTAKAYREFVTNEIVIGIKANVGFSDLTTAEARDIADWFRVAAQAADKLATYIKTKEDFNKTFYVKIVGGSVVITEVCKICGRADDNNLMDKKHEATV